MNALVIFGIGAIVGLLMIFDAILYGIVLHFFWGWFVVPVFGVPALGIVPAIGITLMFVFLADQKNSSTKKEGNFSERFLEGTFITIFDPSLTLFIGWILHFLM